MTKAWYWLAAVGTFYSFLMPSISEAQSPVAVGDGSYASAVPTAHQNDDGYYSPSPKIISNEYKTLFVAPKLLRVPIPTNKWWTDLMVAQRNNGSWYQQQFDGNGNACLLWAYPQVVQPAKTGKTLYFPNAWSPNNGTPPALAKADMDLGPGLFVEHYTGVQLGATDSLLGDFSGAAYPAGWAATGDLVGTAPIPGGTWPGENPPVTGLIGNACLNTFRGTDTTQGTLTSPAFTIQRKYIDLKVGGGSDPVNTCVQLIVNGSVVKTAVGQQDATLRWTQWDVTAYLGQSATIVIKDTTGAGWGFILCNYIVGTDSATNPATLYTSSMVAEKALVSGFSDWTLDYTETGNSGATAQTTIARGVPFVWDRFTGGINPRIHLGAGKTLTGLSGTINTASGSFVASAFAFTMTDAFGGSHVYGVFAPDNTTFKVDGDYVEAQHPAYLVYGFLPSVSNLATFNQYAFARPFNTEVSWTYNGGAATSTSLGGSVDTTWTIKTQALKGFGNLPTLQGFLPHHYRTTKNNLTLNSFSYLTPRGTMKISAGTSFKISFPFRGISPELPAPQPLGVANDYNPTRMAAYMNNFTASHPGSGADTYWQGKEFGLSGQYMTQAAQLGQASPFFAIQSSMRSQLADWYTYTPGEAKNFFARYANWRALIGFNSSFGSVGFNDGHFHYGYYQVGTALLGVHDAAFLNQYGQMARLVAKEYNNWERNDPFLPFMRCFDFWEGHCNAGGLSSPGGQNQESSSESMNSWVGMFLNGAMLGDSAMRDAGAMGYAMESATVNEYWQDWQNTNFPATYGKKSAGIVTSGGVAYGTYFSGDPAWIYAIQWTPANHWNNYLARSKSVAQGQYDALWQERSSASAYNQLYNPGGFILNDSNDPAGLGAYPGDYVLGFEALFNPANTAKQLDDAWTANQGLATDATYAGSVYYMTHALRGLGDQDQTSYTSIPTSQVFINASGVRTYVIYNPLLTSAVAQVYINGVASGTITVPAHSLVSTTSLGGSAAATPYYGMATPVPGVVQFANFDFGGEGFGYHSLTGVNAPGKYRPQEGVSIEVSSPGGVPDGTFNVTGTASGQWLRYTVQVAKTGSYSVSFHVASAAGGSFHIVDEADSVVVGTVTVPATGGAQAYTDVWTTASLTAGRHALRVIEDSGSLSLSRMVFYGIGATADIPLGLTIDLKSVSNGLFVTAENGGNSPLIANRGAAQGWEFFQIVNAGGGNVALLANANGKYVSVLGSSQLLADSASVGTAQTFQWVDIGSGRFGLRSVANGFFVTVPNSTTPLSATSASLGTAESFRFAVHS